MKGQNGYSVSFLQSQIAKRSTERSRRSLKSKMVSVNAVTNQTFKLGFKGFKKLLAKKKGSGRLVY
jgi:hypothetical protein